jgi:broad specificity phosphatase PhoE
MKTFYIFRHGQTYFSKSEIPYGENELTAHILPEARESIEKMGRFLASVNVDQAFRSEFLRCKETAQILESQKVTHFDPNPLFSEFVEPDFEVFLTRMEEAKRFLLSLSANTFALCTHGAVVAALQKLLLDESFHAHELMYYPKTGVVVKVSGGKVENIDFNQ